jgi:hypothetical protein
MRILAQGTLPTALLQREATAEWIPPFLQTLAGENGIQWTLGEKGGMMAITITPHSPAKQ